MSCRIDAPCYINEAEKSESWSISDSHGFRKGTVDCTANPILQMRKLRLGELSPSQRWHWRRKWQATPVFLPGKSHGQRPGKIQSMGLPRVRHD